MVGGLGLVYLWLVFVVCVVFGYCLAAGFGHGGCWFSWFRAAVVVCLLTGGFVLLCSVCLYCFVVYWMVLATITPGCFVVCVSGFCVVCVILLALVCWG